MSNLWHVRNWFKVGKEFSWKLSFYTLGGFLGLFYNNTVFRKAAGKKHEYIISYLRSSLHDVIERYKTYEDNPDIPGNRTIWTIWWQGEAEAPELVKACFRSIRRHAPGTDFKILTKDNLKEYLDVPDFISEAMDRGTLSMANFTDILRLMLLEKYGGLWLDSTIFTGHDIPSDIFEQSFYSLHTKWEDNCYVQQNLYHIFVIGSKKNGKLVSFTKDMFFEYLSKHDTMIDYFMLDYIFYIAYLEFPDIKEEIDSLSYTSERLYDLVNLLNKPVDENAFSSLCNECLFSKLDWHRKYKNTSHGKSTYYDVILSMK